MLVARAHKRHGLSSKIKERGSCHPSARLSAGFRECPKQIHFGWYNFVGRYKIASNLPGDS